MTKGDDLGIDARGVYVQLLAIADHAKNLRRAAKKCSPDEVDVILEAYANARSLCHDITCGNKAPVSLPDLGHIAEDKEYTPGELRAILTGIEVECFKGVGALAKIIALNPDEEVRYG